MGAWAPTGHRLDIVMGQSGIMGVGKVWDSQASWEWARCGIVGTMGVGKVW